MFDSRTSSDMDLELASTTQNSHTSREDNMILPEDLMILIFTHLSRHPQDLLNCALTIRQWTRPALEELYRHPWSYLFTYQFDTEGRVMDKHGSMLLLRTLFQGCIDPSKNLLPYATFARSVNLKWVQDTFDLPEVNIQTLTGFRWTRNEAPKDFLIRHLLSSRPYLGDFVHCLAPRLPRCLFAHLNATTANSFFAEDTHAASTEGVVLLEGTAETDGQGSSSQLVLADSPAAGSQTSDNMENGNSALEWEALLSSNQAPVDAPLDQSLLTTPPLLPVPAAAITSPVSHMANISLAPEIDPGVTTSLLNQEEMAPNTAEAHEAEITQEPQDLHHSDSADQVYAFQQPFVAEESSQHSRATSSASLESTCRLFLALWPLTMEQTQSLVYLDLRYATVTDSLVATLAFTCHRIESLKIATHWQAFPETYSVTDLALASFVQSQGGLKLFHVENHREISQGHELVVTINTLAKLHGHSLETLVLQSHDFQNCNLAALGTACQRLTKFSAPGGAHLFREEIVKLAEECKLTLEHLDFSNSDIETEALRAIMKNTATPEPVRGVLKALILLGMEDMLNEATCQAIGDYGIGLDCFRLDILESEAKDVSLMLSGPCALNLRVLTLGCHDVHGDLANDILGQIARNCRNVELLDVIHWQFSTDAIEKVLRQCRMLRYLNISYTNVGESTARIIARCLGEVKKIPITRQDQNEPSSMFTPTSANALFSSLMHTPTPLNATSTTPTHEEAIEEEEIDWGDDIDWEMQVDTHVAAERETFAEVAEDDDRVDSVKKRGRAKDDDGEGDENEFDGGPAPNSENNDPYRPEPYPIPHGGKKQSQIGLVHHLSNAMDLRTIMNLDLDEAIDMDLSMSVDETTGMDLDMCLDLERYRRKSSSKDIEDFDDFYDDDRLQEGDVEMSDSSIESEDVEESLHRTTRDVKGKGVYVEREPLFVPDSYFSSPTIKYSSSFGSTSSSASCSSSSSASSSKLAPSLASTASSSGQVALTATDMSSLSCNPLLPPLPIPTKEFPTNEVDSHHVSALTVATSSSSACTSASHAILGNDMTTPPTIASDVFAESYQPSSLSKITESALPTHPFETPVHIHSVSTTAAVDVGSTFPDCSSTVYVASCADISDKSVSASSLESVVQAPSDLSNVIDQANQTTISEAETDAGLAASAFQELDAERDLVLPEVPTTELGTEMADDDDLIMLENADDSEDNEDDMEPLDEALLKWTRFSRLEQINIECCSQLSVSTMSHLKALVRARQQAQTQPSSLYGQQTKRESTDASAGDEKDQDDDDEEVWIPRGKSRVWVENEHDMMMTRLNMERGPLLLPRPLPPAPTTTVTVTESTTTTTTTIVVEDVSNQVLSSTMPFEESDIAPPLVDEMGSVVHNTLDPVTAMDSSDVASVPETSAASSALEIAA